MLSVASCTINFSGKVYSNPLLDFVSTSLVQDKGDIQFHYLFNSVYFA